MMNILEESIIYATVLYQGKIRRPSNMPLILHPMEVAQVLSTMTDDEEVITAGILHDIVKDTDGTLEEIEKRFGKRIAGLVDSVSEKKNAGEESKNDWKKRKEESMSVLKNSHDVGVKMVWLADKLTSIRSLAGAYSELGEEVWQKVHQSDQDLQCWYYQTVAELVELSLNRTGAFKELIKHINSIWPGTFDSQKAKYRKYKEVSVEGCKLLGKGAKGEVYRYNDELVIKVYNQNNTYSDVEREIALARRSFVLGIPTAISFGIVSVGPKYGSMFELVEADTISGCIARDPGQVEKYARIMADVAQTIHSVKVDEDDHFLDVKERLLGYVIGGVGRENEELADKCGALLEALPPADTLVHGDFHTGNVFLQMEEPLLIDMDRISRGQPIAELSDLYYFYVILGEDDPAVVEKFMGFPYDVSLKFFDHFLRFYLGTDDEERLKEVTDKASLLGYTRMIRKIRKKGELSKEDRERIGRYMQKTADLVERLDTLMF